MSTQTHAPIQVGRRWVVETDDAARRAILQETCRRCWAPIRVMIFRGTGYCSGLCAERSE